jgi:hypothetical protein
MPNNEPPVRYIPPQGHQYPPPPPQYVATTRQYVETNQRGLRGSHAALIIWGSIIAIPVLICLVCGVLALIGSAASPPQH